MISNKGAPPQVALIGVSGYATVYVDWLLEAQKEQQLRLVAISVLPAEQSLPQVKQLQELGAELFDTYEELLSSAKERIDICYIPTGIQWHARMTIDALRSGCNVLVEKPLAGSLADVEAVQAVERETGRWVAVGFQDMYTEEIATLKKDLTEGLVGKVEAVAMMGAWPRPESYYSRNKWAGKLEADGSKVLDSPLNNAFAHFINLSLYLGASKPDDSSTVAVENAELYRAHDIESFDTATVSALSDENVRFWFGVSHACQKAIEPSIRIIGSEGQVEWTLERSCKVYSDGKVVRSSDVPNYELTRRKMFENVLERLHNPKARICTTQIAKCHTHLIEAIHQASAVKTIDKTAIQNVEIGETKALVPAIRGIEENLQTAYQDLQPLGSIACQNANV